jgi:hypothetical protein
LKKIVLYINMLLLTILNCQAQDYSLLKTIQVNANSIEVDPFGNFYIVEDDKISKYSEYADLLFVFQDLEYGTISTVDVSNPLKPVVFCRDFSILQILDQKMSLLNTINLIERNLDLTETVAIANGDNYWVYDTGSNSLKKMNKSLKPVYESESFISLFSEITMPIKIIESEQHVFVLNDNGVLLFDLFANYIKTIKISNLKDFQILNNKLIYVNERGFISYNLISMEEELLETPNKKIVKSAKVFKNGLLILSNNQLSIYVLK